MTDTPDTMPSAAIEPPCALSSTRLLFTSTTRFYTAALDRDLFGQWSVTRSWGSTRNGQGGGRVSVVTSFEAGMAMLGVIRKRRERCGYRLQGA
ncbi:WGR domain-containing protein [Noviherbaspirillum pedocola]|uniref:WGR domain-containing protein n=1 Tax=Noviherbaspirillum pedocola TaxID=2801341 RepID=A0A934SMB3_9BURK|nr:WGR domain-containing protein [Noviherbaspirillum pedocola]MBK4733201.1 WGR domain-containing protein [Noviherbaspirillum pedocola]